LQAFEGSTPEQIQEYEMPAGFTTSLKLIGCYMLKESKNRQEISPERMQDLMRRWSQKIFKKIEKTLLEKERPEKIELLECEGKIKARCFKCNELITVQSGKIRQLNGNRFLQHVWTHFYTKEEIKNLQQQNDCDEKDESNATNRVLLV
jgi:hypothetical protein